MPRFLDKILVAILLLLAPLHSAWAFTIGVDAGNLGLPTGLHATDIIAKVIDFMLSLSAVIALAAIIWGGITYIAAFGNEKKAAQGKQVIIYAIIGLVIVGASAAIIREIRSAMGV